MWLDEGLSTGSKVPTMSGDRNRKHRFSSLMQKFLAPQDEKAPENCFPFRFPEPCGQWGWVGQKIHKEWSRDISDTAASAGHCSLGGLGLPPTSPCWRNTRQENMGTGEKRSMQVIQQAQGTKGSVRLHSEVTKPKATLNCYFFLKCRSWGLVLVLDL